MDRGIGSWATSRAFLDGDGVAFIEDAGTVGELVLRGDNIFAGYWMRPEATAEAFRGGWFHTGDLGRADEEGFITLVDRKKDMIISGGENVYPVEVEQVLVRHPAVREVAIFGLPEERWGEVVVAAVATELIAWCRARVAHSGASEAVSR